MTQTKIPTEVYAEMTPNPATLKFVTNRLLLEEGQVEFNSKQEAMNYSPLAVELFNFPFITSIFIMGNFVAITKDDSIGWEMINAQLRMYLRDWLMENEVIVSAIPEPKAAAEGTVKLNPEDYSDIDKEIVRLLEEFVNPAVEADGGAIEYKSFNEGIVTVALKGACSGCPSATQTLKGGIEQLLKSKIEGIESVVAEEL